MYKNSTSLKCFCTDILSLNLAFRLSVDLWEAISQLYTRNAISIINYFVLLGIRRAGISTERSISKDIRDKEIKLQSEVAIKK